jgi:hypothetical protein
VCLPDLPQLTRTRQLFNFYDHSKIVLSAQGLSIAHIDKNYVLTRWTLSQVMAHALFAPSSDPEQAKLAQRLLDKLKYCKEVLLSIRNASAGAGSGSENGGVVSGKPLKTSLRWRRRNVDRHFGPGSLGAMSPSPAFLRSLTFFLHSQHRTAHKYIP